MAHNLNFVKGKASMAFVGERPWHSLGTKVDAHMTSAEAIKAAGLDYEVQKFPVKYDIPGSGLRTFKKHAVTVRMDNENPLGLVGKDYQILQNSKAFNFMDYLVGSKEAMYETAGALGEGERIWMLARVPGFIKTIKGDESLKYLLLANGHDGSLAVHVMFTPIRVVCQNTLNGALADVQNRFTVYHTENYEVKMEEAKNALGLANTHFALFEELSQKLVQTKMNDEQFTQYAKDVVFPKKKAVRKLSDATTEEIEEEKMSTRASNIMETLSNLFTDGKGTEIPGVRGTVWAGYNAISEYVDHVRGNDLLKRANSLLFAAGANLKQKALDKAVALV